MKKIKHDYDTFCICRQVSMDIHAGQVRTMGDDKGKPYIIHPERVADELRPKYPLTGDWGDACVAVLHDCIEDYDYTKLPDAQTSDSIYMAKGYLEMRGVPKDIIQDVDYLSKPQGFNYFQFINWVMSTERAIRVKIKDIEDNMKSLEDGKLKEKYQLAWLLLVTELDLIKAERKLKKVRKNAKKSI